MTATPETIVNHRPHRYSGLRPEWKPGESGNPNGRPPKDRCITTLVKEKLELEASKGKTHAQLVADAIIELAQKGDIAAIRELLDRTEGKVADKLQVSGTMLVATPDQLDSAMRLLLEEREKASQLLLDTPDNAPRALQDEPAQGTGGALEAGDAGLG